MVLLSEEVTKWHVQFDPILKKSKNELESLEVHIHNSGSPWMVEFY